MIQINLLEEVVDNTAAYIVETLIYFVAVGMACLVCFIVSLGTSQNLEIERLSKMTLSASLEKLEKQTKHVEGLQKKEQTLSARLTTIARLKTLQRIPILLLDEITQVIPERAWLTEFTQRPGNMNLKGIALDNQTISLFMNQLEKSVFTNDVQLRFSEQYKKGDIDLKRFEINVPLVDSLLARERVVKRRLKEEQLEEERQKRKEEEARKAKLQSLVIDNRTEEEKKKALEVDISRAEFENSDDDETEEERTSDEKPLKEAVAGKIKVLK